MTVPLQRLLRVIRQLREPALLLHAGGQVRCANDPLCQLLGYPGGALDGAPLTTLLAPGEAMPPLRSIDHGAVPCRLRCADGSTVDVALHIDMEDETAPVFITVNLLHDHRHSQTAVELGGDGVWELDLVHGTRYQSTSWCSMLGYSQAEVLADPDFWLHHLHPDDTARALALFGECVASSSLLFSAEFRMLCADGQWKWILSRARVERDATGRALRLIGIHRDIDALRRMEAAWRESRHSLAAWIEQSPDAIAITTCEANSVYVDVNAAFCQMLGARREDLVGRHTRLDRVWSSRAQEQAAFDLLSQGVPLIDLPCSFRSRDGREVHASLSAQRIVVDGQPCLLIARRDISERVSAERRQRDSESRWRFAIEGHGDALWDWNVDKGLMYRSPRWLQLLDLPPDASTVPLDEHRSVILPEDLQREASALRDLLTGQVDEVSGSERLRRRDGSIVWTRYRCRVMERNRYGEPTRIIGTTRDVTQQRLRQQELDRQLDHVSHSGRLLALGEMASAIAHEINQPLAVISSYAGVLVRKTAECDELRQLAANIEEQALRAGQIIWRMRQFARHRDMTPQPVALAGLVGECLAWCRLDTRGRSTRFLARLPSHLPTVAADRIQIQQVLLNLLRNAMQSMDGQTMQSVIVRAVLEPDSATVRIDVGDHGCGLPPEMAAQDWAPFVTTREEGLGLGLPISQSIVTRHGGRLWARPRRTGGTVFSFTLPVLLEIHPAGEVA